MRGQLSELLVVTEAELITIIEPMQEIQKQQSDTLTAIRKGNLRKAIRDIKTQMRELERTRNSWTNPEKQLYAILENDLAEAEAEYEELK